jgi:hypothetical protein
MPGTRTRFSSRWDEAPPTNFFHENSSPISMPTNIAALPPAMLSLALLFLPRNDPARISCLTVNKQFHEAAISWELWVELHIRPHSQCPSGFDDITRCLGGLADSRFRGLTTLVIGRCRGPVTDDGLRSLAKLRYSNFGAADCFALRPFDTCCALLA